MSIVELVIRIFSVLVTFPFTLSSHVVRPIAEITGKKFCNSANPSSESEIENESKENESKEMKQMLLKLLLFIAIVIFSHGLLLRFPSLIFKTAFRPFRLDHLEYIKPTWERATNDNDAIICGNQPLRWHD
jgi:hypothetical protein